MSDEKADIMTQAEMEEAIEENIRHGFMERIGKDQVRLTEKGKRHVEQVLLKKSEKPHE